MRHVHFGCAVVILACFGSSAHADFTFVALGDTAYNGERDYPVYEKLIDRINKEKPAFSVHIGDLWGASNCHDAHYVLIRDRFFARYQQPVVYTPGDNEWTDCHSRAMGGYDVLNRLAFIRQTFFATTNSLGKQTMPLVREADVSDHKAMVENARWDKDKVLFLTAHVTGSRNNLLTRDASLPAEYIARNAANVDWINDSFRIAQQGNYKAVVVSLHANMIESDKSADGPFGDVLQALRLGAERFGKPVLLIHGDFHTLIIDRPLMESRGEAEPPLLANLTRLQVYGAPEIRAVKVTVQPDSTGVFSFATLDP